MQANQERGLRWELATYGLVFLAVFACAHLAIRRFAPYADPLLLPIVALLNGLGLVMIHRLDLDDQRARAGATIPAQPSRCCGRWSAWARSRSW